MTREEFLAKYGEVLVTFSSYYKYCFTFGSYKPPFLMVTFGGAAGDIYKFEVIPETPWMIKDLAEKVCLLSATDHMEFDEYWGL